MIVQCRQCHQEFDVPVTASQIGDWHNGALIQRAMPHLTTSQRELMKTRTCGECFDKICATAE